MRPVRSLFDLAGGPPYKRGTQIESHCGRAAPPQGAGGHLCLHHKFRAGAAISSQKWSWSGETDLSAEPARAQAAARVPQAHGNTGWRARDRPPASQGAQAPLCLTLGCQQGRRRRQHAPFACPSETMRIATLKRRAEFVRIRGGARWSTGSLVLETKPRADTREGKGGLVDDPRFGFTVTKKIGGAVVRNRVRRRLKEAVRALPPGFARPGHDYVLIARAGAFACPFALLQRDLAVAFGRVHQALPPGADGATDYAPHPVSGPGKGSGRNRRSAPAHRKTSP